MSDTWPFTMQCFPDNIMAEARMLLRIVNCMDKMENEPEVDFMETFYLQPALTAFVPSSSGTLHSR